MCCSGTLLWIGLFCRVCHDFEDLHRGDSVWMLVCCWLPVATWQPYWAVAELHPNLHSRKGARFAFAPSLKAMAPLASHASFSDAPRKCETVQSLLLWGLGSPVLHGSDGRLPNGVDHGSLHKPELVRKKSSVIAYRYPFQSILDHASWNKPHEAVRISVGTEVLPHGVCRSCLFDKVPKVGTQQVLYSVPTVHTQPRYSPVQEAHISPYIFCTAQG